jgi:hypothetical protein
LSDSSPAGKDKFEIEQDGEVPFWFMRLTASDGFHLYTWVSRRCLAAGIANELAQLALVYAKGKDSKVGAFWPGGIPLRLEASRVQATR